MLLKCTIYRITVWGKCSHVFHMHCLLKWIATPSSKSQCPMDRRPWGKQMSPSTSSPVSLVPHYRNCPRLRESYCQCYMISAFSLLHRPPSLPRAYNPITTIIGETCKIYVLVYRHEM